MSQDARLACAELSARYAYCCDRDRATVADLFTEDGVLSVVGRTMRGRAEIRQGMAPRAGLVTLHFLTNIVIEVEDEDNARGTAHLLSLGHQAESDPVAFPLPMPVARTGGIYFDRFRRVDGRWLFAERRLDRVFTGAR